MEFQVSFTIILFGTMIILTVAEFYFKKFSSFVFIISFHF